MPYTLKFDRPPAGYTAHASLRGEKVKIIVRELLTTEDGMTLIKRLEGIPSDVINMLRDETPVVCSTLDHMLLHYGEDGEATVYINELDTIATVKGRKAIKVGEPVYEEDILDFHEYRFVGVDVPVDHGVLVIISKGWRKLLYFDFVPLSPGGTPRDYDLWKALGIHYNYLIYQELHGLSDEQWDKFFQNGWFPFVGLKKNTIESLVGWLDQGGTGDEILITAAAEVSERLEHHRQNWTTSKLFEGHRSILLRAADRFEDQDWISVSSLLYPRIEGILRAISSEIGGGGSRQDQLVGALSQAGRLDCVSTSIIFPDRFRTYLNEVYFRNFRPGEPAKMSRNSVGHGVADEHEFDEKASVIAILILEQIFYHVPKDQIGDLEA